MSGRRWREAVEEFAGWVRERYGEGVVVVFGSRARDESYAAGDTDLLVILDRSDLDTLLELFRKAHLVGVPNPEVHLFSVDEAFREARGNTVIMDALLEGITLLDTFGIVEELRRIVLEFVRRRGLERRKDGWWPSLSYPTT